MLAHEVVPEKAMGVGMATAPDGLAAIHQSGCAAAIWKRRVTSSFQSWIDDLDPTRLPRARVILRPEAVRETVTQICASCRMPACNEGQMLIDDAAALASIFNEVVPSTYMQLRFDVVSNNACRKFHIDAVAARLVCTYRGTGTQYGISTDGCEPKNIFTVPTGAPFLMRGTLWPDTAQSGLRHRSPPIEGTGETRLLLVLDPVDDAEHEEHRFVLN